MSRKKTIEELKTIVDQEIEETKAALKEAQRKKRELLKKEQEEKQKKYHAFADEFFSYLTEDEAQNLLKYPKELADFVKATFDKTGEKNETEEAPQEPEIYGQ